MPCNESGSTLRFMISVGAAYLTHMGLAGKKRLVFLPKWRLIERPLEQLVKCLGDHGVTVRVDKQNQKIYVEGELQGGVFKIEGNVYATGGITALGVSNNATTSNNVDFTFRSVTANTFNVKNSIQLSDTLTLNRNGNDVYLSSTDISNPSYIYLDGMDQNYYLDSQGIAYFNSLDCNIFNFGGVTNFEIIDADDRGFTLSFEYNGRTYHFTPSDANVGVS